MHSAVLWFKSGLIEFRLKLERKKLQEKTFLKNPKFSAIFSFVVRSLADVDVHTSFMKNANNNDRGFFFRVLGYTLCGKRSHSGVILSSITPSVRGYYHL